MVKIRDFGWTVALVLVLATTARAQTPDPRTLPLADLSAVRAAGVWTFDWPDGAGGDISYGSGGIGVSEDGAAVYIACSHNTTSGVAKLAIPALGGMARVLAPCRGITRADFDKLMTGYGPGFAWGAGQKLIGGVIEQGGRVCLTAFGSYDANNQAIKSHWCGPDLLHLAGPFGGTVSPGMVKGPMGVVPPEWRATLGGPAFSTAGYSSIISRSSTGAAFSVFDPASVTADGFAMTMLLGCPDSVASCRTYGTPTSNDYNGSELSGGSFIVPGTRTLVAIEREASGPTCYGFATRNQALHGTPYPGPGYDAQHVVWCYSLSDPLDEKGPKGYPYRLVAKLYDLAELAAVKAGAKKPWDVKQYATVDLPGSSASEQVSGGTYNPVTGDFYLLRYLGGGVNTVYVYKGFGAGTGAPPPTATDCVPGTESMVGDNSATAQCVGGLKHVTETWTRTGDIAATNGGKACTPVVSPRFRDDPCTVPPPPPTPGFTGRVRSQAEYTVGGLVQGIRVTLQVPAAQAVPAVGAQVRVQIPVLGGYDTRQGTIYSRKANAYAGTTDWQVVVQLPGVQTLAIRVEVP